MDREVINSARVGCSAHWRGGGVARLPCGHIMCVVSNSAQHLRLSMLLYLIHTHTRTPTHIHTHTLAHTHTSMSVVTGSENNTCQLRCAMISGDILMQPSMGARFVDKSCDIFTCNFIVADHSN